MFSFQACSFVGLEIEHAHLVTTDSQSSGKVFVFVVFGFVGSPMLCWIIGWFRWTRSLLTRHIYLYTASKRYDDPDVIKNQNSEKQRIFGTKNKCLMCWKFTLSKTCDCHTKNCVGVREAKWPKCKSIILMRSRLQENRYNFRTTCQTSKFQLIILSFWFRRRH